VLCRWRALLVCFRETWCSKCDSRTSADEYHHRTRRAVRSRSKLLLISGATPSRRAALQDFDLRAVASLAGASYERCLQCEDAISPSTVPFVVRSPNAYPCSWTFRPISCQSETSDEIILSEQPTLGTVTGDATNLDNAARAYCECEVSGSSRWTRGGGIWSARRVD